jgi:hypothetical protein
VGASDGDGPAPGAGKEDAVFVAAKHSQVIDPTGATRVENAMVICPLVSST